MATSGDLKEYYARRAHEYEKVYLKPERQDDIARLRATLQELLAGQSVLEVACGTGYWTQPISLTARSVLATDVNADVLEIASAKSYPKGNVRFQIADAFRLENIEGQITAGFAGFWWSHVEKSKLDSFLDRLHKRLGRGSLVVFADNNYVEGSSHPITRRDEEGNTYQLRRLEDGSEFEVLKNFPAESRLRARLSGRARKIEFANLTYYWCLSYEIG